MTVADSTPDSECLVKIFERFLWLAKKVVNRTDVGERHGLAALVTRFTHQTQRLAVLLHRLAPRITCSFALEFCTRDVRTLGGHAFAVCIGGSSQILDPYFVSSSRCIFLEGAHIQLISAASVSHERNHFHTSRA